MRPINRVIQERPGCREWLCLSDRPGEKHPGKGEERTVLGGRQGCGEQAPTAQLGKLRRRLRGLVQADTGGPGRAGAPGPAPDPTSCPWLARPSPHHLRALDALDFLVPQGLCTCSPSTPTALAVVAPISPPVAPSPPPTVCPFCASLLPACAGGRTASVCLPSQASPSIGAPDPAGA